VALDVSQRRSDLALRRAENAAKNSFCCSKIKKNMGRGIPCTYPKIKILFPRLLAMPPGVLTTLR